MCKLTAVIACIVGLFALVIMKSGHDSTAEYIGQMPEVVVTAERAYSGLLDTVPVSAPRDAYADIAWPGLLDTVTIIETPVHRLRGSTVPILTYRSPLGVMIDDFHHRVE